MHAETHEKAGQVVTVKLKAPIAIGRDAGLETIQSFLIEDWWDTLAGKSWMVLNGMPAAAFAYATRSMDRLPLDDEVVYGKNTDTGMGHLVHTSEIGTNP